MSEEEQKYFKGLIGFTFDSDDIRYIEKIVDKKDKEIERLNNDIKVLLKENENKEKVINAQDNIINEIERYINEEYIYDELGMKIFDASKLQDKLQELKGVDKE